MSPLETTTNLLKFEMTQHYNNEKENKKGHNSEILQTQCINYCPFFILVIAPRQIKNYS